VPEVPAVPAVAEVPVVEAKAAPVISTVALPAAFPYGYYGFPAARFGYGFNYGFPQYPAYSYYF
jgi:hypothetical protein